MRRGGLQGLWGWLILWHCYSFLPSKQTAEPPREVGQLLPQEKVSTVRLSWATPKLMILENLFRICCVWPVLACGWGVSREAESYKVLCGLRTGCWALSCGLLDKFRTLSSLGCLCSCREGLGHFPVGKFRSTRAQVFSPSFLLLLVRGRHGANTWCRSSPRELSPMAAASGGFSGWRWPLRTWTEECVSDYGGEGLP